MMAAMASRIAALEKQLRDTRPPTSSSAQAPVEEGQSFKKTQQPKQPPKKQTTNATCSSQDKERPASANDSGRGDILVHNGSSSQYFNEVLLSRVIADDDGLGHSLLLSASPQSLVEQIASATGTDLSPFNALGILSSPLPSPPSRLHPPKAVAVRLWGLFVDRVDGCSCLKLLHVPTDQVRVFAAIHDPAAVMYDDLALAFAIYYAARVADDDAADGECEGGENGNNQDGDRSEQQQQGHESRAREAELLQYKLGLEQSLAHSDFLDRPTLTGLLALAIYLAALRVCNRSKGLWVLNGLAVRVAQSLGLHRDGGRLASLTPFDAEMRRRLWWHLLTCDWRASEDYGLEGGRDRSSATRSFLLDTDVLLPLNVDDQLLFPGMRTRPPSHEGWTTMTFALIHIALCQAAQRLSMEAPSPERSGGNGGSSGRETGAKTASPEARRKGIMAQVRADVERRLVHCNTVVPQQRRTATCARFLLQKLDFVSRLQWAILAHRHGADSNGDGDSRRRRSRKTDSDLVSDANLAEALAILRPHLVREDEVLLQYAWVRKAYPQYHVGMYVLWHLCRKPTGPHVAEAWEAVDLFFAQEEKVVQSGGGRGVGLGSKFAVLAALKAKAEAVRERAARADAARERPSMSTVPVEAVHTVDKTSSTLNVPAVPPSLLFDFNDFLLDVDLLDSGLDDVWSAWGDEQSMAL